MQESTTLPLKLVEWNELCAHTVQLMPCCMARSYVTAWNFGFKPCFFFIQETETSDLFLHEDDDDEDEDEDESRSWRR